MNLRKHLTNSTLALMLTSASAFAVTSTFSVNTIFINTFSINQNTAMNFGNLMANSATSYRLDTNDTVTAIAPGGGAWGSPASGQYTLVDSSGTAAIDINITNLVANSGVTPSNPRCNYNGGGEFLCPSTNQANPGAGGKTLLLGMDITTDGTQAPLSAATPSFDIVITYN